MSENTTKNPNQPHDPAVVVAGETNEAEAAFDAMTKSADEDSPEWLAAENLMSEKGGIFADTVPTTQAGVLAKLKHLNVVERFDHPNYEGTYLARHYKTMVTYLEKVTGADIADADAELLALVADFWKSYERAKKAHDDSTAHRAEVEAMPDYPAEPSQQLAHDDYDAFIKRRNEQFAFKERHSSGLYDAWNKVSEQMGAAAKALFAIPAKTLPGAIEKLKIVRLAVGATTEEGDGDADLECYQDHKAPWIDSAIADLERLAVERVTIAQTGQPDPAMTAFAELLAAEATLTEMERRVDAKTLDENAPEVEAVRNKDIAALDRFTETEPTTIQGAIAKLQYLVDNSDNDDREALNVRAVVAYLEKAAGSESAPVAQAPDPAVDAGIEREKAGDAVNAKRPDEYPDESAWEDSADYKAIQKRFYDALGLFASAVPTTPAGAIAKLKEISEDAHEDAEEHCNTIIAYLEGTAGVQVTAPVADPLPDLWAKWETKSAEINEYGKTHETVDILVPGLEEIEQQIAKETPLTLEGAKVLVCLLKDDCQTPSGDDRQTQICNNLIVGLENMGGGIQLSDAPFTDTEPGPLMSGNLSEIDRELQRLYAGPDGDTDRMEFLEDQIRDLPATSLEDVNVKLRRLRQYANETEWGADHNKLLASILEGVAAFGRPMDASFTETQPEPANDTRARRAFEAVKHHPAVAAVAALAVVAIVAAFQNSGTVKAALAGLFDWGF